MFMLPLGQTKKNILEKHHIVRGENSGQNY